MWLSATLLLVESACRLLGRHPQLVCRSIENVSILERPGKLQFPFDPACRTGLHVTVRIPGIAVANFARRRMRASRGRKGLS